MDIILASSSPRRKELLKMIVSDFIVKPGCFDEDKVHFHGDFEEYVKELSYNKALSIAEDIKYNSLIIGADTIVALDGKVLLKPSDEDEAFCMLRSLSGRTHDVYSGITVIRTPDMKCLTEAVRTTITFSELSDDEIWKYIRTGDPMDKAGAYGIQGPAGAFVERIDGCYYNVVGLPLNKLKKLMDKLL